MPHTLTSEEIKWAQDVQKTNGVPASVTLGTYIFESGAGTSNLAKNHNNGFGVTGSGDAGTHYSNGTAWAKYSSMEESFKAYGELLSTSRYTEHTAGAATIREYLEGVVAGGYCPDAGYVDNVMQVIADNNLTQYDGGTVSGESISGEKISLTSSEDVGFWAGTAMTIVKVVFLLVLLVLCALFTYNAFRG